MWTLQIQLGDEDVEKYCSSAVRLTPDIADLVQRILGQVARVI